MGPERPRDWPGIMYVVSAGSPCLPQSPEEEEAIRLDLSRDRPR